MGDTHTNTGEDEEEITQEDSWHVISAFFEEKGLVRQQLESFDDFLQYKMQDIVDEDPTIVLTPEAQHMPGQAAAQTSVRVLSLRFLALREGRNARFSFASRYSSIRFG